MVGKINFYYDMQNLSQIKKPEDVAKSFESIFYSFLMKEMEKSIQNDHSSFGYNFYFDMFMMQIAQVMADSGQLGLKDFILKAIETYERNLQRGDFGEINKISNKDK